MKSIVIKIVLFLIVISSLLLTIDSYFLDSTNASVNSFNSLYEADKNSVDIVFIGNSHLSKGINTNIIDAKCNVNSLKVHAGGIQIAQIYYNLLEILKYQSPKVVGLELFPLVHSDNISNKLFNSKNKMLSKGMKGEYFKRFGIPKYKEIKLIDPKNNWYHMFNFFRFHENWTNLESVSKSLQNRFSVSAKELNYNHNKILWHLNSSSIEGYKKRMFIKKDIYFSEAEKIYLKKIIVLSDEYNFDLLLFTIPVYEEYYNKVKDSIDNTSLKIYNYAKEYKEIKFYDINKELGGLSATYIMGEKVSENQHLNYKGMIKTSNLLADFINKEYNLKPNSLFINDDTVEKLIYNSKKTARDTSYLGNVETVNGKNYYDLENKELITISLAERRVKLEGWMFKKGVNLKRGSKIIALKKGDDFVYVSGKDLVDNSNQGKSFEKSGYSINISKYMLEKGRYKIFHIIKSHDNELYVQDMWKWIVIK
ncbi:MAG: hypothetical protein HOF75_05005 [Flavobacteriaceae bacterium]|jgi:hypothetical protein|nr:hypothetical protein [Flavobacteriaceae bacterium]MBT6704302.1 hypothetical protein [Flavobacteriaceae bacterium]MBT7242412.1 hypothetical protein [Flavobacteriaceae bacterium]|tara:strand:+ start:1568 stop:3007 length:1440 start_codon:yes stop_codon:yes gene_type:complete